MGNIVWIKTPGSQCTTKFKLGRVTSRVSHHSVEVNGVPRHIKDIRPFQGPIPPSESETDSENQSAEGGIPITLEPIPLDDTPDATRPEFVWGWRSYRSTHEGHSQNEWGSLLPRHKRVCPYAALPLRKTYHFRTHKCRPQASPTEGYDLKIKRARVHLGSRAPSFEKWVKSGWITDHRV